MMADNIVEQIKEDFEKAGNERHAMEQQVYFNYAAYLGYSIEFTKTKGGVVLLKMSADTNRSQANFNLIYQAVRIVLAKLTAEQPVPVIVPASKDSDDIVTATVAQRFGSWVWNQKKTWAGGMPRKGIQSIWLWSIIGGTSFLGVYYNPDTDSIELEPISIFELYPERGKRSIGECDYVDRVFKRSRGYVERNYPNVTLPSDVNEPSGNSAMSVQQEQIFNLLGGTPFVARSSQPSDIGHFILVERWWRDRVVKGIINGKKPVLLSEEENIYEEIPFVQYDYEFIPDRWYGKSPIEESIVPNTIYTFLQRSRIDLCKIAMNPPLLVDQFTEMQERESVKPGERISCDLNAPPRYLEAPMEPQYVTQQIAEMKELVMANFGVFEASRGEAPFAGVSGRALSRMYAFDESKFGPILSRGHESNASAYQMILNRAKLISTDVSFAALGNVGKSQIETFKRADMNRHYDVIAQTGSLLESDKASTREFALKIAGTPMAQEIGIKKLLRMADVGIPDDDLDPEANELSLIDMENAMLTTGEIVEVEDFHNHDLHIVHQNQLRLSPQWSSYSDDVKGAIEGHLRTHIFKQEAVERAEEARMMAMQAQQMAATAPPAPPGKVGHPAEPTKPNRELNEPLMEKPNGTSP